MKKLILATALVSVGLVACDPKNGTNTDGTNVINTSLTSFSGKLVEMGYSSTGPNPFKLNTLPWSKGATTLQLVTENAEVVGNANVAADGSFTVASLGIPKTLKVINKGDFSGENGCQSSVQISDPAASVVTAHASVLVGGKTFESQPTSITTDEKTFLTTKMWQLMYADRPVTLQGKLTCTQAGVTSAPASGEINVALQKGWNTVAVEFTYIANGSSSISNIKYTNDKLPTEWVTSIY